MFKFPKQVLRPFFICLIAFIGFQNLYGQDLVKDKDLSKIRVDQLSNVDIAKIKAQLTSSGLTIDQAEQMALAKGMSQVEFTKLKQRLNSNNNGLIDDKLNKTTDRNTTEKTNNSSDSLDAFKPYKSVPFIDPLIFGSELYTSIAPSFEPNSKLATPLNYVLGPDDQISVNVYGVQEYSGDLLVSSEGNVTIPNIGQVKVAGLSIENATQRLKTIMGNSVYPYLKTGMAKLSVTLSKIRSIKVTIIGSVRPGNFTLSSLSTVFNALYIAGGPSAFGSFREIELVRNNKVVRKIDLYKLLLNGDQTDNVGLKDDDLIRIPTYRTRIKIQGQVRRPGIFEVLPGEKFANVITYASGFTDTAYKASVKIFQRTDRERQLKDLEAADYTTYEPVSGDVFVVYKILNRFENRVRIDGAVYRPDVYQLSANMKVSDLIRKADGLLEDAFTGRGQIIRLDEDLTKTLVSFDIKKALANDPANNIILRREDNVIISSVQDLKDTFKVIIQGEVRLPGQYSYLQNLALKDLILQAGGFTDAAQKNIEIARIIKRDSIGIADNRESEIINVEIDGDLTSPLANIPLKAYDVITVRRKAGYIVPESMRISGAVQYPGLYAIGNRNERISDIVKRAGGYIQDAYPEGAYLKRFRTSLEKQRTDEVAKRLQVNLNDSSGKLLNEINQDFERIPLDLVSILKAPGSIVDITVKANDEIFIPKFDAQVKISGAVLLATQVPYNSKNSFKDYIGTAGGFSERAWKRKVYIVYANGRAATTKHFLFFKFYPPVLPGSELVVPNKMDKKPTNTAEVIGISSALASLAGVVIALLRL